MAEAYVGVDAAIYISQPGAWEEVGSVVNVDLTHEWAEIDVSRRGAKYRQKLQGLGDFAASGEIIKDHTATAQGLMETAFLNKTPLEFLILDQDNNTTGAKGYRCTMNIRAWNETQPLEDGVRIQFELQNDPTDDPTPETAPVSAPPP